MSREDQTGPDSTIMVPIRGGGGGREEGRQPGTIVEAQGKVLGSGVPVG